MDREQWLTQVKEEILEPALPICDAHHHLWDHPGRRYLLDELPTQVAAGIVSFADLTLGDRVGAVLAGGESRA